MIAIENGWLIDADIYQFVLKERTFTYDKNGNELYKNQTYHHSIEDALTYYAKIKQRKFVEENYINLSQAIKEFRKINEEITILIEKETKRIR